MKNKKSQETGQILVIFAVALIVMLGFAALAIDGGMIFVDRRYSQSVADTSSLAGAGSAAQFLEEKGISWATFHCSTDPGSLVKQALDFGYAAAVSRAASNQVTTLDRDITDQHGVEITCTENGFQKYIDVKTIITSTVATSLVQVVYPFPIRNTVTAVVRIHPRTELAYNRAVVALSDSCANNDGGVVFDGTSDVYIHGGGVYSNSCIDASGNVHVDVENGGINFVGNLTTHGHPVLDPDTSRDTAPLPRQHIGPLNCGSSAPVSVNGAGNIGPGNYTQIKLTNGTLQLSPGLYCLSGDVEIHGGEILGDGVTFYLMKDGSKNTNVTINGNATVHLNAPTESTVVGGAKVGLLFYMADGNAGNISLLGSAGSSFTGAVFGGDASIDVGGTTGVNPTYNTQLVGKYVKVHGTSQIDINFEILPLYNEEPTLDSIE